MAKYEEKLTSTCYEAFVPGARQQIFCHCLFEIRSSMPEMKRYEGEGALTATRTWAIPIPITLTVLKNPINLVNPLLPSRVPTTFSSICTR